MRLFKIVRLASCFLLLTPFLNAQIAKFTVSNEFENVRRHQDFGFYNWDTNVYVQLYYRPEQDFVFQVFDSKFNKLKKEKTVAIKKEDYEHEGVFTVKGQHYWLYSTWKRDEDKEELWAHAMDRTTYKFVDKPIRISESTKLASNMGYGKYNFCRSKKNDFILMTSRLKPKEKRDRYNKDVIGFYLYNHQMKTTYAHQIEMPYTEAEMDIYDKAVDGRGNIFVLARVSLNNALDGEQKENKGLSRFELMRVNQKNHVMEGIKLDLDDKYLHDVILSDDLLGNIIITGYYSNKESGAPDGAYVFRVELNEKNEIQKLKKTYCEFPKEMLMAYESEKTIRKMVKRKNKGKDIGAANLQFRKAVFGEDGSITIFGEEYYVVVHTHRSSNGSTTTTYTYYYENIYVLKANKDGKTQWCRKIPKYQKGKRDGDLGFYSRTINGNHYIFYIDNKKNINLPETETPELHLSGRGGMLTCVKIDANGGMAKEIVLDTKEEKLKLSPRWFEDVGDNILVQRLKKSRKESVVFKLELR